MYYNGKIKKIKPNFFRLLVLIRLNLCIFMRHYHLLTTGVYMLIFSFIYKEYLCIYLLFLFIFFQRFYDELAICYEWKIRGQFIFIQMKDDGYQSAGDIKSVIVYITNILIICIIEKNISFVSKGSKMQLRPRLILFFSTRYNFHIHQVQIYCRYRYLKPKILTPH